MKDAALTSDAFGSEPDTIPSSPELEIPESIADLAMPEATDGDRAIEIANEDVAAEFDALAREEANELDRLTRDWDGGEGWEANVEHGRAFVDRFGDEASRRVLDAYGLGDHAALVRIASAAGRHITDLERELAELKGEVAAVPGAGGEPASLSDKMRQDLEDEHRQLRRRADYWTHGATRRRVRQIMETLHGTQPIHTPLSGAAKPAW